MKFTRIVATLIFLENSVIPQVCHQATSYNLDTIQHRIKLAFNVKNYQTEFKMFTVQLLSIQYVKIVTEKSTVNSKESPKQNSLLAFLRLSKAYTKLQN